MSLQSRSREKAEENKKRKAAESNKPMSDRQKRLRANSGTSGKGSPLKPSPKPEAKSTKQPFKKAFAAARKEAVAAGNPGGGTFEWNGKKYNTKSADDKPKGGSAVSSASKAVKSVAKAVKKAVKPVADTPANKKIVSESAVGGGPRQIGAKKGAMQRSKMRRKLRNAAPKTAPKTATDSKLKPPVTPKKTRTVVETNQSMKLKPGERRSKFVEKEVEEPGERRTQQSMKLKPGQRGRGGLASGGSVPKKEKEKKVTKVRTGLDRFKPVPPGKGRFDPVQGPRYPAPTLGARKYKTEGPKQGPGHKKGGKVRGVGAAKRGFGRGRIV